MTPAIRRETRVRIIGWGSPITGILSGWVGVQVARGANHCFKPERYRNGNTTRKRGIQRRPRLRVGLPVKPQAQAVICSGSRYHNTRSVGWIAVLIAAGFLAADHLGL